MERGGYGGRSGGGFAYSGGWRGRGIGGAGGWGNDGGFGRGRGGRNGGFQISSGRAPRGRKTESESTIEKAAKARRSVCPFSVSPGGDYQYHPRPQYHHQQQQQHNLQSWFSSQGGRSSGMWRPTHGGGKGGEGRGRGWWRQSGVQVQSETEVQSSFSENLSGGARKRKHCFGGVDEILILEEILPKLPIKSLLRFKAVSKLWQSEIQSSTFKAKYFPGSSRLLRNKYDLFDANLKVVENITEDMFKIDVIEHEQCLIQEDIYAIYSGKRINFQIYGSCNGLILCGLLKKFFYICNPGTREFRAVPENKILEDASDISFGYDKSTDDYKVVPVDIFDFKLKVNIYSLKTNSWTTSFEIYHCGYLMDPRFLSRNYLNGALHWKIIKEDDSNSNLKILVFNLVDEKFVEFVVPDRFIVQKDTSYYFSIFCEELIIIQRLDNKNMDIMRMKEYGVGSSWAKFLEIRNLNSQEGRWGYFEPICYLGDDEQTLLAVYQDQLLKYNIKEQTPEVIADMKFLEKVVVYKPSLVSVN